MDPLLESAWLKVHRANAHFTRLKAQIDAFLERHHNIVGVYIDRKTGEKIYRLDRLLPKPALSLNPIIGDALYNYRSALDHLMWALVVISGGSPTDHTQFPIFLNKEGFNDPRRGVRMWQGVSPTIQAVIEREQPYQGGAGGQLLWRLHRLHSVDKHRHFNLVFWFYEGAWADPANLRVWRSLADRLMTNFGRVEQGTILARIPREYVNVDFYPTFDVAFDESSNAPGEPVRLVLGGIDNLVHNILDQYQQLFFSTQNG